MELKDFESLLDSKIDPLHKSIERLEKANEKMVSVLSVIAKQEEIMKFLQQEITEIKEDTDVLFGRIRDIEKDSGNKMWDVVKIFGAALLAGIVGLLAGKGIK